MRGQSELFQGHPSWRFIRMFERATYGIIVRWLVQILSNVRKT